MILQEAIIKEIKHDGILILQELCGELLFLNFDKNKTINDFKHLKINCEYRIEFELKSFYWKKGSKYITNAILTFII